MTIETEVNKLTAAAERIAAALEKVMRDLNNEQNGQNPTRVTELANPAPEVDDVATHAKPAAATPVSDVTRDVGTTVTAADIQRESHAAYGRLMSKGYDQGAASGAIRAMITAFAPNLTEVPAHQLPALLTRLSGLGI